MRTTILVVTILTLISPLSTTVVDPWEAFLIQKALKNRKVQIALQTLCEKPTQPTKAAVKCVRERGKVVLRAGENAAVIYTDITATEETEVVELTRKPDGKTKADDIKETVKAVVKVAFKEMQEAERSNAELMAGWKLGPRVYKIPLHDLSVSFEEYLILERIDGWTIGERFVSLKENIYSPEASNDNDLELTYQRKLLNMLIAYLGGVMRVWNEKHRYCDAHDKNAMMRAAPMEKCEQMQEKEGEEEGVTFEFIIEGDQKRCLIWSQEYLVLVDPYSMVPLEVATSRQGCGKGAEPTKPKPVDLFRVFELWSKNKDELIKRFPDVKLAEKMDRIIKKVPAELPPREELRRGIKILKRLNDLRVEYNARAKRLRNLTKAHSVGISDHTQRTVSTRSRSLE